MNAEKNKIDEGGLHVNCRKATYFFSTSLERPLTLREKFLMRLHLLFCSSCRLFRRQWLLLQNKFDSNAELPQLAEMSEERKEALKKKIESGK